MKNLLKTTQIKNLYILIIVLLFVACKKDITYLNKQAYNNNFKYKVKIESIKKLATKFIKEQINYKYSIIQFNDPIISTIDSLLDSNNLPALYIINFTENDGWIIFSADYRMEPILAYNTEGIFGYGIIPQGVEAWIEESVSFIEFLRINDTLCHPTSYIAWKEIYDDYGLDEQELLIIHPKNNEPTPNEYCDMPTNSYIKGPLLETTWGQQCTYNDNLDDCNGNDMCDHVPTGCGPTAMAQVMHYWSHPSQFPFSTMPLDHGDLNVAGLMEDIGNQLDYIQYNCNNTSTSMYYVRNSLENDYDFNNPIKTDYSFYLTVEDIKNNKPVILQGRNTRNTYREWWTLWITINIYTDGHIWVSDGYQYRYKNCPNYTLHWNKLLHMNWGWWEVMPITFIHSNNDYNGWYKFDDWRIIDENGNLIWNFQYAQHMIYNITPN